MGWMGSFLTHDYYGLFVREMKTCPGSWNEGCYITDFWSSERKSALCAHCDYGFPNYHCSPILYPSRFLSYLWLFASFHTSGESPQVQDNFCACNKQQAFHPVPDSSWYSFPPGAFVPLCNYLCCASGPLVQHRNWVRDKRDLFFRVLAVLGRKSLDPKSLEIQ